MKHIFGWVIVAGWFFVALGLPIIFKFGNGPLITQKYSGLYIRILVSYTIFVAILFML